MKKLLCTLLLTAGMAYAFGQNVQLRFDKNSAQAGYAAARLQKALLAKKYKLAAGGYTLHISEDEKLGKEAYSVTPKGKTISIAGGDGTGMVYAALTVAEDVANGVKLEAIKTSSGKPQMQLRAIKFDMPWDTYRHHLSLDQHYNTCRDPKYWEAFLDMMADNRLNSLTLWNLHPFTYMIRPKNYPLATPFNAQELKEWQTLFKGIFKMAKERGIDTYLVPFNIFFSKEFAQNYAVQKPNLEHDFFVDGDTSALVKKYTRECVAQVLQEYPDLDGIGFTLGEGMGGMTPQQREDWMTETYIAGMRDAGRPVKLIHRIPFSSTTGSLGVTSVETEIMTRKTIEEQAAMPFIKGPIWADLKYNWSHPFSTTKLIKVHGGKLFDTYFRQPANFKISWTARNEDVFCLRWGVPQFIREHVKANSQPYTGGYIIGSESYIPGKDYFTNPSIKVNWKYAFERQWLYYKMWGRLLYDSNTPDKVFSSEFVRRYGAAGKNLLAASSLAGKTLLATGKFFDSTYDLTLYGEGMMGQFGKDKNMRYIDVDNQIKRPVLDSTASISIADYVAAINSGKKIDPAKVTPLMIADELERDCKKALELVKNVNTSNNTGLMFEVADIKTWANMGLNMAERMRGGVALQMYRTKGGEDNKQKAISHLTNALTYWKNVAAITRPIYQDMPLTHLMEDGGRTWKQNYNEKFHWAKITPQVAADVEVAKQAMQGKF